jgi:hypothetical protein
MIRSRSIRAVWLAVSVAMLVSCRPQSPPEPLPAIPVYEIRPTDEGGAAIVPAPARDPLGTVSTSKRVSLTSNNADARTLLLWLAQEAGVSILVSPDVSSRVSVSFNNVPAIDAMRAIISQAGLSVLSSAMQSPWPPVVFHQLPVNVNEASIETITARFGVSLELAKWLVENRPRR